MPWHSSSSATTSCRLCSTCFGWPSCCWRPGASGGPFGVAPVTLVGAAALMATPGIVATQPGGAYTDIVGFALLASAVALLVNSEQSCASELSRPVASPRWRPV